MRRPQKAVIRPSPLAQVQYPRPPSTPGPEMGLVRDPQFWKRFSMAAHQAEDKETCPGPSKSLESGYGGQWLEEQHREKRRVQMLCLWMTLAVVLVITAGAVAVWYFLHGTGKI